MTVQVEFGFCVDAVKAFRSTDYNSFRSLERAVVEGLFEPCFAYIGDRSNPALILDIVIVMEKCWWVVYMKWGERICRFCKSTRKEGRDSVILKRGESTSLEDIPDELRPVIIYLIDEGHIPNPWLELTI